ncbi:MAG: SWIM zinc finger family protein, partial [Asticcacaulis sp.]|nr:SWIM zinc finger family protein [Asticcacaulis sp.]
MALSLDKLEALAPDQASLNAARKLLNPAQWPLLATDTHGLLWGECRGSGATPYRVVLAEADAGYKCSCPSRKFPCKHALALMWIRAEGKLTFNPADAPDWVKDWVSRRRGGGAKAAGDENKPKASIAASSETEVAEVDPFAEARAAAIREKNRRAREASILAGLAELDVWILDQVDRGMAAFTGQCTQTCKLIAQRLVDAKAPGLATRIENLPATLFALPENMRELAAVEELGQLYLIAEAYRRQKSLPPELRMDI